MQRRTRRRHSVQPSRIEYIMSGELTCQSNSSKWRGDDHLPKLPSKNGEMLISQPVTTLLWSIIYLLPEFYENQSPPITLRVILLRDKQTNTDRNITPLSGYGGSSNRFKLLSPLAPTEVAVLIVNRCTVIVTRAHHIAIRRNRTITVARLAMAMFGY